MHLSYGITEGSDAMIVAPSSPDRANMFSICFPDEVFDYRLLVDFGGGIDGVTLDDAYIDEIDMIGIGRILDTASHGSHSAFDPLEFLCLRWMEMTLLLMFITRYDVISDGNNNDMSIFEYLPVSQNFPLITPQALTT
ncbi:hypothetical protein CK203_084533 [Vitis vinifera]|uniref:Uncharacterized protein n=1 Tax=Vitis vinifera TaxID=29760 RepID=A0A438DNU9_VITVI|nr:hypothetical protein CK203_084533 [Vitis vinifera]